jgi:hypothetical protein
VHFGHNDHVTEITSDWRSREDAHAPRSALHPAQRGPRAYVYDTDAIERVCIHCTLMLEGGEWTHERSCPAAAAARRRTA